MTHREIAALAFRIFGLVTFAEAIEYLVGAVTTGTAHLINSIRHVPMNTELSNATGNGTVGCALLLLAWVCWWNADRLARRTFPEDSTGNGGAFATADQLLTIAFSSIGLFVIISWLPTAIQVIALPLINGESFEDYYWGRHEPLKVTIVQMTVMLVLGIWLLFGNRGLVRLTRWARSTDNLPEATTPCEPPTPPGG